jgi:hypothetical protein
MNEDTLVAAQIRAYLIATTEGIRQLLEWRERWDRDRHLGPEVEAALRQEWEQLANRAEALIASEPVDAEEHRS